MSPKSMARRVRAAIEHGDGRVDRAREPTRDAHARARAAAVAMRRRAQIAEFGRRTGSHTARKLLAVLARRLRGFDGGSVASVHVGSG